MPTCRVITPVGPGHERFVPRVRASVTEAMCRPGRFSSIEHVIVDDTEGLLGRSAARNRAINGADWYFFLDCDDRMTPDAFELCQFDSTATFGAVLLEGKEHHNVHPCGWEEIRKYGAMGTLSMGLFYKDVGVRFDETMDAGEDYDFYMRLPDFVKVPQPLVAIGYNLPSATGPRGYNDIDWLGTCRRVIDRYLSGDAVLEPACTAPGQPGDVPQPVSIAG